MARTEEEIISFMKRINEELKTIAKDVDFEDPRAVNRPRDYQVYQDTYALTVEFIRNGKQ